MRSYHEAEQAFTAGKLMQADDLCRRILTAEPAHSGALHLAGLLALRRRYGQAAVDLLTRAVAAEPGNIPYRVHLATAQGAVGKAEDATRTLEEAIELDPESDEAHYNLGLIRLHTGKPEAALASLGRAAELAPDVARIHLNIGGALQQTGDAEEAIGAFTEAARIEPDWPLAHAHLADALEDVGRIEEARTAAGRALALRPSQARAEMVLARLDLHDGWPEAARDRLRKVVGGTARTPVHEAALNGLGHALDRLGNHDEAFDAFAKSRKQRAATPLAAHADHEKTLRHIADCREWFSAARTSNWPEASIDQAPAPIFVVGFPRSGAELVERLLAAHPDFIVAKGQPWLARMLATVEGPLPRILGDLDEAEIGRLRAAYRAEVEATLGDAAEGRRVVDRNPLNLLELGAVRRIFPEAKVLTTIRDPRDTVLSCLMNRSMFDHALLHLGEIKELSGFYGAVMELWLHFRQVLGLDVIEVRYEDMVRDTPTAAAEILDFLGAEAISVDLDCRDGGMERWRHYRDHLMPALPPVSAFVNVLGYGWQQQS